MSSNTETRQEVVDEMFDILRSIAADERVAEASRLAAIQQLATLVNESWTPTAKVEA